MKKLLCMLFLLFPIIAHSQTQDEWHRQSAERQIREYYQKRLNQNEEELRDAQNELKGLQDLPDSKFTEDVKSRGAYLGAKIEVLKAEKKALEEEFNKKMGELQRQTTAKSGQSQKTRRQENAARQKQNQSRQAEASRMAEEQAQRMRAEEAAARKVREEQERQVQLKTDKQKNMRDTSPCYNAQRANAGYKASPQAFAQVSAQVSNNQVQRTLSNVPSCKSGKQMPGNSTFNKLQQRNRGEAVNGVFRSNHQENTALLNRKLDAKKAASNGRYNEKWSLEQKKVALDTWLGSVSEIQKSSSIDEQKDSLQKNIASHLMSEKQAAERDEDAVINALSQQNGVAAEQRHYAGIVPDRRNTEAHFWSQIEDPGKQSEIIDVLVRQCRDSQGYVNSNAIRQVVEAVDLGVELMKRGQRLGVDSPVTQRANEVLKVFHDMCANGFCKK